MKKKNIAILCSLALMPAITVCAIVGYVLSSANDIAPSDASDLALDRVVVSDEDNAYTHFAKAAALLNSTDWWWPDDEERSFLGDIYNGTRSDPEYLADFIKKQKKVFTLLNSGLACQTCQSPQLNQYDDLVSFLSDWGDLVSLLELKIIHQKENDDHDGVASTSCQIIHFGNIVQKDAQFGCTYLKGLDFLGEGLEQTRIQAALPNVSREILSKYANAISNIAPLEKGLTKASKADYQVASNTVDDYGNGDTFLGEKKENWGMEKLEYFFQPNKTKQILAKLYREYLKNALCNLNEVVPCDYEEIIGCEDGAPLLRSAPNALGKRLAWMIAPSQTTVLLRRLRTQCDLDATRIIVACRLHEMDHGQLPPTLESLMPDYLEALPNDPYNHKPFHYDVDKSIIYSVGEDLIDSGGSERTFDYGDSRLQAFYNPPPEDLVFYIHGRPEANKPAGESEPAEEHKPFEKTEAVESSP